MRLVNIQDGSQEFLVGNEAYVVDPNGKRANRRVPVIKVSTNEKLSFPASLEVSLKTVETVDEEVVKTPAPPIDPTADPTAGDYVHPEFQEGE